MKINLGAVLLSGLVVGVISGCAQHIPLQRTQSELIKPGDTAEALASKLGKATANLIHNFEYQGKIYEARHYKLQTGSTQQSSVVCTPVCFPIFYTVPVTAPYVVLLQGSPPALITAGLVEELSRSPDSSISDLMPAMKEAAAKASAKK
jgi:hypothetical protein